MDVYDELYHKMLDEISKDMKNLFPFLKIMAREFAKIPLKKTIDEVPRVLVVGEIYVRRDDFAVDELIRHCAHKEIIAKVSGIAEWIHYTDFVRDYDMAKRYKLLPWWKKPFSRELRKLIFFKIEEAWKHGVEKKALKALSEANLIPPHPHDMDKIMTTQENTSSTWSLTRRLRFQPVPPPQPWKKVIRGSSTYPPSPA